MNRIFKLIFLSMAVVVSGVAAQAVNYWWDVNGALDGSGGVSPSGNWDGTAQNWNTDSTGLGGGSFSGTTTTNDNVVFSAGTDATGAYTITVSATQDVRSLTFEDGSPLLTGGTLNLATNAFMTNTVSSTIGSTLIGAATGLTKTGPGTLTLTGANTYTGGTTINAGTLAVNGGIVTNSNVELINTSGSSSASLMVTNGGYVGGFSTTFLLGNANSSQNNRVYVGSASALGVSSMIDFNGKYLYYGYSLACLDIRNSGIVVDSGGVVTNVSRTLIGNGFNAFGNYLIITNGGKFYNNGQYAQIGYAGYCSNNWAYVGGSDGTGAQATWNLGGIDLRIGGGGTNVGNYVMVDKGGLLTNGYVTVGRSIGPVGNYMVITNGGQVFTKTASNIGYDSGANSNYVIVAGADGATNATWNLGGQQLNFGFNLGATGNWMTVASGGVLTNGNVSLYGFGSVFNLGGDAYLSGVNLNSSDEQVVFTGGTLHATAKGNLIYGAGFGTINSTATIDARYTVTNTAPLTGPGSLIKTGSSNLVLAANNTYSGATTVSNGVLKLTAAGSISNSAVVNVVSGAVFDVSAYAPYTLTNQILAGNGVVTGSVVVAAGAGVSGGDTSGGGVLSFSNNLTLSPGAVVHSYYNATTNNGINVAGTLSLPTVATVQVTQVSGSLPSTYVLFTFGAGAGAASSNGSLPGWVITGGRSYSQAVVNNGQVKLVSPTGMIVEIY
jgi:autotransporter-associated beta strand protein